jgi:hypothetical protein
LELAETRAVLAGAKVGIVCAGKVSTTAELRRDPVKSVMDTLRIGINALEAAAQERIDSSFFSAPAPDIPKV